VFTFFLFPSHDQGGAFGAIFKLIELRGKAKVNALEGFEKLVTQLQKEREHTLLEMEKLKIHIQELEAKLKSSNDE